MDLFISNPTHSIRCSLELLMDVEHLVSLSKSISEMHLAFPLPIHWSTKDQRIKY